MSETRRAGQATALVDELSLDRPRDRDELVHLRGQLPDEVAILGRPDARRVDGRHDERPRPARCGEGDRGARADDLGPEHVVVDDVRLDLGEVRREAVTAWSSSIASITSTGMPLRCSLRTALPFDSATTLASKDSRSRRVRRL